MAISLEDVNGGPIESPRQKFRAQIGFNFYKHGLPDDCDSLDEAIDDAIDRMSQRELASAIFAALESDDES